MGNFLSTSSSVLGPSVPSSDGEVVGEGVFGEPYPSSSAEARYPLAVKAEFHLPLSAQHLFLVARGASSGGALVLHEEEQQPSTQDDAQAVTAGGAAGEVKIEVEALFRDIDDLEHMKVVRLSRQDGHEGVGVYVSHRSVSGQASPSRPTQLTPPNTLSTP